MDKKRDRKLVLFDFDGTLTVEDTLFELIKYIHGRPAFYVGIFRLLPDLLLYKLKLIAAQKAKEKVLTYFFGGFPSEIFKKKCRQFASTRIPYILHHETLCILEQWKERDADVIIVTASAEDWIAPWCELKQVGYIASHLDVSDGKLTGKLSGKNCNGQEKVNRIRAAIDLSSYGEIIAYGDSKGDLPMLLLATTAYYCG